MATSTVNTCTRCRQTIRWEQLQGMRVYTETPRGRRVYRTRCGCGDVARDQHGRRTKEPA